MSAGLTGLKSRRDELFVDAYFTARLDASSETDMAVETFPETSPFALAQVMSEEFWPNGNGEATP